LTKEGVEKLLKQPHDRVSQEKIQMIYYLNEKKKKEVFPRGVLQSS